jgi:hypothetical protein
MTTDLVSTDDRSLVALDQEAAATALEHILATGDLAKLSALEPRLDGSTEQIDDLHVQAPPLSLRAFLEGCVEVRWQANKRTDQFGHDVTPVPRNWYNSSTLVAECNYVDEIVVGQIRRASEVGYKGRYKVIGTACTTCGAVRWTMYPRGARGLPTRCASCNGARTIHHASQGNTGVRRPWQSERQRGAGSATWRGGRRMRAGGYIQVWVSPDDPLFAMAEKSGYALEHRLIVARALGRPLARWERVHHRNGIRDDNRVENLELWKHAHPSGIRQADYHCPGCRCGETNDN